MRALLTLISRLAAYGSALFLTAMMVITVIDIILRAMFNLPITGAYDLVLLCLVGTVFLSIPDVFLRNENIVVDLVDHLLGAFAVSLLKAFANIAAVAFLGVLAWRMIQPALDSLRFNEVSPDLSIPMIVHWCLMIVGIVLALPAAISMLVDALRGVRRGAP